MSEKLQVTAAVLFSLVIGGALTEAAEYLSPRCLGVKRAPLNSQPELRRTLEGLLQERAIGCFALQSSSDCMLMVITYELCEDRISLSRADSVAGYACQQLRSQKACDWVMNR